MLPLFIPCGSLAMLLAVVPTIDHPTRAPSGRNATERADRASGEHGTSAPVARLGLADGSTVCGRLTFLPSAGVLIVAGTTAERQSTLDLVSMSFVNEVTLLDPDSA